MWRTAVAILLIAVGAYVAINALITTEPERVEAEVERLLDLARQGGDDAVDAIMDALADDYRGEGMFGRERIRYYLGRYVGRQAITDLTTGDYQALWVGEEIVVPVLSIQAKTERMRVNPILRVTFAQRDGEWRIVNVGRWRLER